MNTLAAWSLFVTMTTYITMVTSQIIAGIPRNSVPTTSIRRPQTVRETDRNSLRCVLQPVPNHINKYRVHLFSLGSSLDFYCAQGTVFYPEKCTCDWPKDRSMVLPMVPTTSRPMIRPLPGQPIRPGFNPAIDNMRPILTTTPEHDSFALCVVEDCLWYAIHGLSSQTWKRCRTTIKHGTDGGNMHGVLFCRNEPRSSGCGATGTCRFRPDPDRNYYQEFAIGFGWFKRPCPIGTLFREETCKCDDLAPVSSLRCRAELFVPFDGMPIEDKAGTSIPIGNNGNVDSVANAGRFDGSGRLTIWMYSNVDFGELIEINLRFYDFPGGRTEQVLVSNCFDKELGSIEIATHPRKKEVVFRGNSAMTGPVEFTIPYQEKMWKNVTYVYDGLTLTGKVNEEEKSVPMRGHLDIRFSGFEIGMCNGRGYVGYIDEFRVYRCINHFGMPRPNMNTGFTRNLQ